MKPEILKGQGDCRCGVPMLALSTRQITEKVGVSIGTVHATVQDRTVDLPTTIVGKDGKERMASV